MRLQSRFILGIVIISVLLIFPQTVFSFLDTGKLDKTIDLKVTSRSSCSFVELMECIAPEVCFCDTQEDELVEFEAYYEHPDPTQPLCMWAEELPEGASFPVVVGDGSVMSYFSWIPTFCQEGEYLVTILVGPNCGDITAQPFFVNIIVYDSPRPPAIAAYPQTDTVKSGELVDVDVMATDPDQLECGDDDLVLSVTPEIENTFFDLGGGIGYFDWYPGEDSLGENIFTFEVVDRAGFVASVDTIVTVEESFMCSDVDNTGEINIADLVYMVDWMFHGGDEPYPRWTADVDNTGEINIADLVYMVDWMFHDGNAPVCDNDLNSFFTNKPITCNLGSFVFINDSSPGSTGLTRNYTHSKNISVLSQFQNWTHVTSGNMSCTPTGTASGIEYWNRTLPGLDRGSNLSGIADRLHGMMGTSNATGTDIGGFINGITAWINRSGYASNMTITIIGVYVNANLSVIVRGVNVTGWIGNVSNFYPVTPDMVLIEFIDKDEFVLLAIGNHVVAVHSIDNTPNARGNYNVALMDPQTGQIIETEITPDGEIYTSFAADGTPGDTVEGIDGLISISLK